MILYSALKTLGLGYVLAHNSFLILLCFVLKEKNKTQTEGHEHFYFTISRNRKLRSLSYFSSKKDILAINSETSLTPLIQWLCVLCSSPHISSGFKRSDKPLNTL